MRIIPVSRSEKKSNAKLDLIKYSLRSGIPILTICTTERDEIIRMAEQLNIPMDQFQRPIALNELLLNKSVPEEVCINDVSGMLNTLLQRHYKTKCVYGNEYTDTTETVNCKLESETFHSVPDEDEQLISKFLPIDCSMDDIYVFKMKIADNEIDSEYDCLDESALLSLTSDCIGMRVYINNDKYLCSTIYYTWIEKDNNRLTSYGSPYVKLMAKAFVWADNATFIRKLKSLKASDIQIHISATFEHAFCSICGADMLENGCDHIPGQVYDRSLCYRKFTNDNCTRVDDNDSTVSVKIPRNDASYIFDNIEHGINKTPKIPIKIKYHVKGLKQIKDIDIGDWIDLRAAETVEMWEGDFKLISLGVSMKLPKGYEAHVVPRSSTFVKWGILQTNSMGVIDNSYSGTDDIWYFPAYATKRTKIKKNDRICQFRIVPKQPMVRFEECDVLDEKNRGGFGSTGTN